MKLASFVNGGGIFWEPGTGIWSQVAGTSLHFFTIGKAKHSLLINYWEALPRLLKQFVLSKYFTGIIIAFSDNLC